MIRKFLYTKPYRFSKNNPTKPWVEIDDKKNFAGVYPMKFNRSDGSIEETVIDDISGIVNSSDYLEVVRDDI